MTNELPDPLEQMQTDWQQAETPPVNVDAIKRRLRWRWLFTGIDVLGLFIIWGIMAWALTNMSSLLQWVYWSFFFVVCVIATFSTIQLRLRALWRTDDTISAVIDHARRDSELRIQSGRLTIWVTLSIAVFVFVWMLITGWFDALPLLEYLKLQFNALIFTLVWCGFIVVIGAWMRERGLRQQLELDRIERELSNDA